MPIFKTRCAACEREKDKFLHSESGRQLLHHCECGGVLTFLPSFGRGLTYFEEGRGRWIHNLGDQPVYITSHWQHKQEMARAGVAEAPPRRGTPGCWA
jgi:hypothetical protein